MLTFPGIQKIGSSPALPAVTEIVTKKETPDVGTSGEERGFVEFTEKEILSMPKKFQKLLSLSTPLTKLNSHL